jgi:hypothetical protein
MALQFSTTGLDLSGLGQGIAKGLEQRAENKRYERKLLENEFNDFSKTFDESKITNSEDAKEFTDYVFQWKEKKKEALKAQQGGLFKRGDAEKANQLEKEASEAYAKAYSVYADRIDYNSKIKEYSNVIDSLPKRGIIVPKDLYAMRSYLHDTPVSKLKMEDIPDPNSIPVVSDAKDVSAYKLALENSKKNIVTEVVGEPIVIGKGILGANKEGIKIEKVQDFKVGNPEDISYTSENQAVGNRIQNNASMFWNGFKSQLDSSDPIARASAEAELSKVSKAANKPADAINMFDYFAYRNQGFEKVAMKPPRYDKDSLQLALKEFSAMNAQEKMKIAQENKDLAQTLTFMNFLKTPGSQAILMNYKPGADGQEGTFTINPNIPKPIQDKLNTLGFGDTETLKSMYKGLEATFGKDFATFMRNFGTAINPGTTGTPGISGEHLENKR